jgi:phage shock protein PspC (stress-responsive transcriptional regulator)
MKTTVQISLNGIAFNLDEDACQQLKYYISELQLHFADDDEIIEDIEARIADLLSMRIKSADHAVSLNDVNEIIDIIGSPNDIDDAANSSDKFKKKIENVNSNVKKRLYRDTENKVIAGVCSGIGHYFNLDATWIRVTFIVFMVISLRIDGMRFWFSSKFFFGIPFVMFVYIVLWIVLPRTKTPRQNLEMHGYTSVRHNANGIKAKNNNSENFVKKIFRLLIQIFAGVSLSIIGIIGSLLLITGIACFFGGSLFGGTNMISLLDYVYIGEVNMWIVKLMIAVLIFIPVCLLIYLSIKILMGFKIKDKPVLIIFLIMWIIAVVFAFGSAVSAAKLYRYSASVKEVREDVNFGNLKTLNIKIPDNIRPCEIAFFNWDNTVLYENPESESLFICPDIHIIRVDSIPENYITAVKSANASTRMEAKAKAQNISGGYAMSDSATIMLVPSEFDRYNKWSSEMIDIFIYLPDSTVVNMYR